jgi:site-specific DNA-cytosine methylase
MTAFDRVWRDLTKQVLSREDYPDLLDDEVAVSLYAGGGGDSEGARMAGIPTVYAADGWDTALDVHRANHPEAEHDLVWFGDEEGGGGHDDMVRRILDVVDGRKWHLHGSPPCTHFSAASSKNNFGRRVDDGLEQTNWYLELVRRLLRSDNSPLSWSMENSPRLKGILAEADSYNMPMSEKIKQLERQMPILSASDFGVPQIRRRLFIGDNWRAQPNKRVKTKVTDLLPNILDEEKDIIESGHKPSALDEMLDRQQISRKVRDMMIESPYINATGAINVGSGGSPWNEEKRGYTWKHTHPANRPIPAIAASNPITHAWNRVLSPTEAGIITGFPKDYDWSPDVGKYYDSGGTVSLAPQAIIGNSVSPPVARSRYANIIPTQTTLLNWRR